MVTDMLNENNYDEKKHHQIKYFFFLQLLIIIILIFIFLPIFLLLLNYEDFDRTLNISYFFFYIFMQIFLIFSLVYKIRFNRDIILDFIKASPRTKSSIILSIHIIGLAIFFSCSIYYLIKILN